MSYVLAYSCSTCHGPGVDSLLSGLRGGVSAPRVASFESLSRSPIFQWPDRREEEIYRDRLVRHLLHDWSEVKTQLEEQGIDLREQRYGVILASTKGDIEDFIWDASPDLDFDPLANVQEEFLLQAELRPTERICVSNACASSHSALWLAQLWLQSGVCDHVVILAGDSVGPFIHRGFQSLFALSRKRSRPFHKDRDGLLLGDGTAVLCLSNTPSEFHLGPVGLDAEGYAATRPERSGSSLMRAIAQCALETKADFVVAHGTGTQANDQIEDRVFAAYSQGVEGFRGVTSCKWSVGHTLGASGLVDIIAAMESLREQVLFPMATTEEPDPTFESLLLTPGNFDKSPSGELKQALVTSLGFGGIHSAVEVRMVQP